MRNIVNPRIVLLQTMSRYIDPAPPLNKRGKKALQTEGDEALDEKKEQPSKPCPECLRHTGGERAEVAQDTDAHTE